MLTINGKPLEKSFIFSGGEVQIKLPNLDYEFQGDIQQYSLDIKTKLKSSNDIMELLLTTGALNFYYPEYDKNLTINYFPYARQDRRCQEGEANSADYILNLLIAQGYKEIHFADLHNPKILDQYRFLQHVEFHELTSCRIIELNPHCLDGIDYLVAPDAGSMDKVKTISDKFGIPFVFASKKRDMSTGAIISYELDTMNQDIKGKNLLVIDDICDGGRTFIELSKELIKHEAGSWSLYVTHGIFSNGLLGLYQTGRYKKIFTTNSFTDDVSDVTKVYVNDFIEVFKI